MDPFDLRAITRAVIDSNTTDQRDDMLKAVRAAIPDDRIEDALIQALEPFVHRTIREGWHRPASNPSKPRPSSKVTELRESWRTHLETVRYTVADGSVPKIGDFTAADLQFVADGLQAQAVACRTRADALIQIRREMDAHGVTRVRDLPDAVLQPLMEQIAA